MESPLRTLSWLLVIGGFLLGSGCSPGAATDSGNDSGGSATGGSATGGSATGGSATGGSATGGDPGADGGAPPAGSGGTSNPLAAYPDWVPACMQSRHLAPCPSCLDPDCIVCAWGTDEEVAAAGAECDSPENYDGACSCGSGCGTGAGLCYE
jgi:hypothetical protein